MHYKCIRKVHSSPIEEWADFNTNLLQTSKQIYPAKDKMYDKFWIISNY